MAPINRLCFLTTTTALFCCCCCLLSFGIDLSSARDDPLALIDSISKFDNCIVDATISYLNPKLYPPKDTNELRRLCQMQSDSFKCIRERSKGAPSLIRRGVLTFVQSRQRFHKKVCTNLNSEYSQNLIEASKCQLGKPFEQFKATDQYFVDQLSLIVRKNYNDSGPELKQFCCTIWNVRRRHTNSIEKDCNKQKEVALELMNSVIPSDTSIICDDDEKLNKICPALEPIKLDPSKPSSNVIMQLTQKSPALIGLFIVSTLGEQL